MHQCFNTQTNIQSKFTHLLITIIGIEDEKRKTHNHGEIVIS